MNKVYKRLTAAAFDKAVEQHPRLSERALELTRMVLVDGIDQRLVVEREMAEGREITKQLVSAWVIKVYKASQRLHDKMPSPSLEKRGRHPMSALQKIEARDRRDALRAAQEATA